MRRTHMPSHAARRARALLSAAAVVILGSALLPNAAFADETPTPTPEATTSATATPSPEAIDTTEPEATAEPEPTATREATATATPEPTTEPSATPEPTPEATEDVDDLGIPTPLAGDYIGSNTEDEADPGDYSATLGQDSGEIGSVEAYSLKSFQAGNLISDKAMYTSGTMSASTIQAFFEKKVPKCSSGYTCLKDFRQTTISKSKNSYCTGTYTGARNESAATIISKVAKACNVSEKVLIVMLQKEQGLVTHVWPSDWRYDTAMGYACPDTGPGGSANCNSTYFGFQNQMYMAAYQLQRYSKDSYFNWYPVGKTSQVRYDVETSCGSGPVYIQNKATAAMYYYTPYQPNRASLNAGYGVGDSCSSYGNRNFVNYYTDWFGSTQTGGGTGVSTPGYTVKGAIKTAWDKAKSTLGQPTMNESCGLPQNGCYQNFQNGKIYWRPGHSAFSVSGAILVRWQSQNYERGILGYPTSNQSCGLPQGGCYQNFENGKIYRTTSSTAYIVRSSILNAWAKQGYERGDLGYPTANQSCGLAQGGCLQTFQNGRIYWKPGRTSQVVSGSILNAWTKRGAEHGTLGYPQNDAWCKLPQGGCYQNFDGGKIYWRPGSVSHAVTDAILNQWKATGYERGRLGYPTSGATTNKNGVVVQRFEHGRITWKSGRGTRVVYN